MLARRKVLGLAAIAPAIALFPKAATAACLPDFGKVKTKHITKWEVLYKTAHGKPNGLALTDNPKEVWVIDQGLDHWVTLTNIADGSTVREFKADVVGPSGIVIDDEGVMWITSTHNSLIVACDPMSGKTLGKYTTPGAGRIYQKRGDPPARSSPLKSAYPEASREVGGARFSSGTRAGLAPGQLPLSTEEGAGGTGAHGILSKGDLLIYACPPSREMVVVNKKTWEVQATWPTPGNRAHGTTWADQSKTSLWNGDSNLNSFHKYDLTTGNISEVLQLPSDSPVIHGAKLIGSYMYCCDDVGWIWRFAV
jgi:hypothetical protein